MRRIIMKVSKISPSIIFAVIFFVSIGCSGNKEEKLSKESSLVLKKIVEEEKMSEILKNEYDLREKCGSYCINYYQKVFRSKFKEKSDNYATDSDYISHYNKKINNCCMLVKSKSHLIKKVGTIITTECIIDVHENNIFGVFTNTSSEKVTDVNNNSMKEITISGKENIISECRVLDQKCKSKEEWNKLIKPYMEE
jgi:hypothetical protein